MFNTLKKNNQNGFTLIEILVVIGIIAVLAAIVIIAINPARQFAQARNTQRTSDSAAILNAIGQNIADNKGVIPAAITTTAQEIKKTGGADLCSALVPTYVPALAMDPSLANSAGITDCTTDYVTGYSVVKDSAGRITVKALTPELSQPIQITR